MEQINKVKDLIQKEWMNSLVEIYQKMMAEIGEQEHYLYKFFESNSTLLSNLLRELVTDYLN